MKSFFQKKSIYCWGKVQSTKLKSAGLTLRGHSWRHVNRLSPPEASICHGLGCSVKNLEISSDFSEKRCQSQQNMYINDILAPALHDMKEHFKHEDLTFQKNRAPSHISNKTQAWCRDNFPWFWSKELCPPSSPDLNQMDFSFWSMLETEACCSPHTTVESLKVFLVKVWAKIPQKKLCAAVESFSGWIKQVIASYWKIYCVIVFWEVEIKYAACNFRFP